ncbi:MAG: hypothetical protein AVDCRST_MAG87-434, partial [uncultured Thermomicrobiales bacterium]
HSRPGHRRGHRGEAPQRSHRRHPLGLPRPLHPLRQHGARV